MADFMTVFGIWLGAACTLAIWSFLYKDNPFYKVAEHIFVGISAAYWFIYTIYNVLIPNLFSKLIEDPSGNWLLVIPGILGILMLSRLFQKWDWLSQYPMALIIGTSAGLALLQYLKTDVITQMTSTMLNPLHASSVTVGIGQVILIIGTISALVYFYFSIRHTGVVGGVAKVGIFFLMISFGAAFGYTAMARISLLIGRLQFLFVDWLHVLKM